MLEIKVIPSGTNPKSLSERAGLVRVKLFTQNGESGPIGSLKAVRDMVAEFVSGIYGPAPTTEELAALEVSLTGLILEPDETARFERIVGLDSVDAEEVEGYVVERCDCPEPYKVHAHLLQNGTHRSKFMTYGEALALFDWAMEHDKIAEVRTATTLLRRIRATGIAVDDAQIEEWRMAVPEEERKRYEEAEQELIAKQFLNNLLR